ncbi:Phage protein [Lactococcus cremoris]|nr:Phage protein [Lactococcus cremoris]
MSELEKARQEVEQVCFAYDKAGITGEIKDWKEYYELENSLIKKVELANQPQLTIPKSVADELDSVFAGIDATDIGYVLDQTGPYGSRAFNDYYFKNKNIVALYLAGKALGVDLVKVVEG